MTIKPIPDNVKDMLGQLSGPQQVALKTYIASLRSEINELQEQLLAAKEEDPNVHYHGGEKCTIDHGHAEHKHGHNDEEHAHKHGHDEHKHPHHEDGGACDHKDHDHKHHDHKHHDDSEEPKAHKEHAFHEHHDHHDCKLDHDHDHGHGHKHGHDAKEKDEVPAWKKAASGGDAGAAPFGGSWGEEASVNAGKDNKMEE